MSVPPSTRTVVCRETVSQGRVSICKWTEDQGSFFHRRTNKHTVDRRNVEETEARKLVGVLHVYCKRLGQVPPPGRFVSNFTHIDTPPKRIGTPTSSKGPICPTLRLELFLDCLYSRSSSPSSGHDPGTGIVANHLYRHGRSNSRQKGIKSCVLPCLFPRVRNSMFSSQFEHRPLSFSNPAKHQLSSRRKLKGREEVSVHHRVPQDSSLVVLRASPRPFLPEVVLGKILSPLPRP